MNVSGRSEVIKSSVYMLTCGTPCATEGWPWIWNNWLMVCTGRYRWSSFQSAYQPTVCFLSSCDSGGLLGYVKEDINNTHQIDAIIEVVRYIYIYKYDSIHNVWNPAITKNKKKTIEQNSAILDLHFLGPPYHQGLSHVGQWSVSLDVQVA